MIDYSPTGCSSCVSVTNLYAWPIIVEWVLILPGETLPLPRYCTPNSSGLLSLDLWFADGTQSATPKAR